LKKAAKGLDLINLGQAFQSTVVPGKNDQL